MALIQFLPISMTFRPTEGSRFRCDQCRNGYQSRFQPFTAGIVSDMLRTAGNIFGGVLGGAGQGAYEVQRAIGGSAHDDAFAIAVEEAKQHFHQCTLRQMGLSRRLLERRGRSVRRLRAELRRGVRLEPRAGQSRRRAQPALRARAPDRLRFVNRHERGRRASGAVATFGQPGGQRVERSIDRGRFVSNCGTLSNSKFCPECGRP